MINISLIDIHKGETRDIALDATIRAAAPEIQPTYCREIAAHSGGRYYPIVDLTPHSVHNIVSMEQSSLLPRDHPRGEHGGIFMIRSHVTRYLIFA
ncbi:MAG: hypothetical protein N2V71_04980 [Methanophagales archaeon]|nr:hypothetical protein [Methanophagales archaeon]MCW3139948.1 hypothetical protein [Methanophagales archaeon]MCW7070264.1 hypothetical protein [Methanophagales archaeon]